MGSRPNARPVTVVASALALRIRARHDDLALLVGLRPDLPSLFLPFGPVAEGDALALGLHPLEDALLHLGREVGPLDADVDDGDAERRRQLPRRGRHLLHDAFPLLADDLHEGLRRDFLAEARGDDVVEPGHRPRLVPDRPEELEWIDSSLLRPAGIAEIEGERVDVVSDGEFIEAGDSIAVVRVDGNRIVVRRLRRKD